MVNELYLANRDSVMLDIKLNDEFFLADQIGPEAFSKNGPNWDLLREKYGDGIYINRGTPLEWKEEILTLPKLKEELANLTIGSHWSNLSLTGYKTDSFTVQAQRKGKFPGEKGIETCIYCFTLDPGDDTLIMGVRAGRESGIGKIVCTPAGAVKFPEQKIRSNPPHNAPDPLALAVYEEGLEEAGILPAEIKGPFFAGAYHHASGGSGSPANVVLYQTILENKFFGDEIINKHAQAMEKYHSLRAEYDGSDLEKELHARTAMKKIAKKDARFPCDAWENSSLQKFKNDPSELIKLFKSGKVELLHGMYGAFALYFLTAKSEWCGKKWYDKLMELPSFKENVREDFVAKRGGTFRRD